MFKDIFIVVEDRPGSLAKVGEALGKAGVNIEGICAMTVEGKGLVHILVQDAAAARQALEANDIFGSGELDVLVLEVGDRPNALGYVTRQLANAGVNIHLAYLATSTRLVIGVDDIQKAISVFEPGTSEQTP
jgi:hypothetical protein